MDAVELFKDCFDAPEAAGAEASDGEDCVHSLFVFFVGRSVLALRTLRL
jgi:hypothetical protein